MSIRSTDFGIESWYHYKDLDAWEEVALGKAEGHIYSRNTNPTVQVFEEKMRALEGAERATSFATGMAAISNTLFTVLEPGDRVVSIKDTYGGTSRLSLDFLPRNRIEVTLCDTTDHEALEREVAKGCKLLYLESPTNPTTKVLEGSPIAVGYLPPQSVEYFSIAVPMFLRLDLQAVN